jgi:hypothetical protein
MINMAIKPDNSLMNIVLERMKLISVIMMIFLQVQSNHAVDDLDLVEWVRRMHHQGANFQVVHDDSGHQTTLTAHLNQGGGQPYRIIVPHVPVPGSTQTNINPYKRGFDGREIFQINTVCQSYVCPFQFFGIPELEMEHIYTTEELSYGSSLPAILLHPQVDDVDAGHYQLSPSHIKHLPSSYLYSDRHSFFLTRCIQERWYPIDSFGLPLNLANPVVVQYALNTGTRIGLAEGYQIPGSPLGFLGRGFYSIEENGVRKLGGGNTLYSFRNQSGAIQALPPVHITLNPDQNTGVFFTDLANSSCLHPHVATLCFQGQNLASRNYNSFVSLVALTSKLPHLNRLEFSGRNLLDDSRFLGRLLNPVDQNPSLIKVFACCQSNNQYIENGFAGLSLVNQEQALATLPHFTLFLKRLTLRNSTAINDALLSNLVFGQLVNLNLEGCPYITQASVSLLAERNPALQILNLSSTRLQSFKLDRSRDPILFRNLGELRLSSILSLGEVNLEAPFLTYISLDHCRNLDRLALTSATSLETFSCQNTNLTFSSFDQIFQQKRGHISLNINGCNNITGIDKTILETFSPGNALNQLNLNGRSDVADHHVKILSFNTNLRKLYLSNTPIGPLGILALGLNRSLETLYLDACLVNEAVFLTLIENLRGNANLSLLCLGLRNSTISIGMRQVLHERKSQNLRLTLN